ncbi:SRPBCC domain-containing protein [Pseudolysinimonas sp.]|jgi:uncharacterized protein YndB with AHSA1/START domain|uniref:SRPBCC domain-containing protein n=1 Tax=Pseudolysinimonas sp. TaxID=2680009 RepID=UPI0037834636
MTDSTVPDIPVTSDTDVFITRSFAAPRDIVWRFFTEPEYLARWFGPATVHVDPASVVVDAVAGGTWDLDMVDDASGARYPIRTRLTVVVPPEYLEGVISADAQEGELRDVTLRIWLHDHGATTRMTLHQGPFAPQFLAPTREGWNESFHKVDDLLAGGVA